MRIENCKCSKCETVPEWKNIKFNYTIPDRNISEAFFECVCGHKEESENLKSLCQEWNDTGIDVKKIRFFIENNLGKEWVSYAN